MQYSASSCNRPYYKILKYDRATDVCCCEIAASRVRLLSDQYLAAVGRRSAGSYLNAKLQCIISPMQSGQSWFAAQLNNCAQ